MKEIKAKESVYLEEYDVHVKPYLNYAEIQSIANAVCKSDNWAERQMNEDMCLALFATDMGQEKIEEIGHDALIESGLIYALYNAVENVCQIDEAVEYTESIQRSLTQIVKELPKYSDQIKEVMNRGSKLYKSTKE